MSQATFSLQNTVAVLNNTPTVLTTLVNNLSEDWIKANEGENTWTILEVIAHLIICDESNWLPRADIILSDKEQKQFTSINMMAHFELASNNSLAALLEQFSKLRKKMIKQLLSYNLQEADFLKTATHPVIGEVNLQQLLSTWVAHDLTHIGQIARIMATQCKKDIGPFIEFLKRLH